MHYSSIFITSNFYDYNKTNSNYMVDSLLEMEIYELQARRFLHFSINKITLAYSQPLK